MNASTCPWCAAALPAQRAHRCPGCGLCICPQCQASPILAALRDAAAAGVTFKSDRLRELADYARSKGGAL